MKKIVVWLMLGCIVLSLVGCNGSKSNTTISGKEDGVEQQDDVKEDSNNEEIKSDEVIDENWGVDENCVTEKNDVKLRANIKFPYLCGIVEGTGKIAYQTDNSLVLLGKEIDFNEPEVEDGKIENIFPAYFEKVTEIMEAYRGAGFKDYKFDITSKEILTINEYEMCKYIGKHTFSSRKESFEIGFVAYATKLKGNDAIVYWMVFDETEEQSLGRLIESHADKMAQTLHE